MPVAPPVRLELPLREAPPSRSTRSREPGEARLTLDEFFRRIRYVTLKLTNGCNLHCSYCNVEALTPQTPRMSMERFRQVARLLVANSESPYVGLEFHGGEPLLLTDEWFEEAVHSGRELAREHGKYVEFPLVTNATMLTEERLLRLHRLGIRFCISVDGPPEINDAARGGGRAVERALGLFRKHRIAHGVLTVMSRANFRRLGQVMDWFQQVGIDDFRVNFLQPQGRGSDGEQLLTGDEMFEGIRQVLDHMFRTGVAVSEAETLLIVDRFQRGRNPQPELSCWEFQCQAGRSYVAVDHAGTIHACGTDLSNHPIGHLDADLDVNHYEATLRRLHHKDDWTIRCFGCDARRICRHSCPTSDHNSLEYRKHECRYTKLLYRHLCEHPEVPAAIGAVLRLRRQHSRP